MFLLFFYAANAFGQDTLKEVEFYFETDSIAVEQGKTFTNFLVLKNQTDQQLNIKSLMPFEKYPGILLISKIPSFVGPNSELKVFVKFIASVDFMKLTSNVITFELEYHLDQAEPAKLNANFFRTIAELEDIFVFPLLAENLIDPLIPESNISLMVENIGYASRSLLLEFESNSSEIQVQNKSIVVNLEGKEKQLVELKISNRQRINYLPTYNIQVKTIDRNKNTVLSTNTIKILILSNTTQMLRNTTISTDKNYAALDYNQSSSGFDYTQFKANSDMQIGTSIRSIFNTSIDYYNNENTYSLYNTFLDLERKGSSVRLGTIYGNDYDYSVSGRGAKVIANFGLNRKVEALVFDSSYNVFSTYSSELQTSKNVAAKYEFGQLDRFNGKVSYIFEHNPQLLVDTQVSHFKSAFKLLENHNFRVEAGISHQNALVSKIQKAGVTSSINYDTRYKRWEINSLNSFASTLYAGMNRGAINTYQNVGYRLNPTQRLYLNYQNLQSKPEYIYNKNSSDIINPSILDPYNFYSTHALKSGIQISKKKWNFNFSPQIEKQKSISSISNSDMLSYRFSTTINTSYKKHTVNISGEYSYSETSKTLLKFSSFKAMLSYSYNKISLNGTIQYNPNTIYDLNYFSTNSEDFINYNFYSSYNFKALQSKISGYISAGFNLSQLYNNMNQNINANLEYKITESWNTTANFNYSNYESLLTNSYKGDNYQFRIGIKKFLSNAISGDYNTINLQFFQDKNLDGILDSDEAVMANEIIKLDSYIAKTDKNGRVTFKNVPKGSYRLRVNESKGIRLMRDPMLLVAKSVSLKIGLGKNNVVRGKLIEIKQTYDNLASDVRGIVVYAEDEQGVVTYTAIDQNDEFEFFLKNGKYRIYIENNKYEYLKPSQTVQLNNADHPEVMIFNYRKKDREIKVKKF